MSKQAAPRPPTGTTTPGPSARATICAGRFGRWRARGRRTVGARRVNQVSSGASLIQVAGRSFVRIDRHNNPSVPAYRLGDINKKVKHLLQPGDRFFAVWQVNRVSTISRHERVVPAARAVDVVGGARIESKTRSTGPNAITISIGARWDRTPISPQFLELLQGALALGMRAMLGPRRFLAHIRRLQTVTVFSTNGGKGGEGAKGGDLAATTRHAVRPSASAC